MCLMVGGQRQVDMNISINKRKHHGDARPSLSCLAFRVVPVVAKDASIYIKFCGWVIFIVVIRDVERVVQESATKIMGGCTYHRR